MYNGQRCLVDTVGVMLAGATRPQARLAQRHVRANAAPGPLAGDEAGLVAPAAAFANAVSAHVLDFDDNCYAGFVHGSAVIVPAAVSVAQARHRHG
ncbi:MmgE/PrpD family protein [Candidatus Sodalis endolongispinus]|uniref:MmgE/PrpD family protein n=1 Tax=Candidatus Sodalis endolongispinus TaxID=2812662 RepID=A0ABS5YA64_9GAMM|nr:MmgE/PrpD family protein [Candidatus Sodalis endolongispinus]MBT9431848.1 MmgE/PrpD family protein [Candidatus Sodalis endolongispinus]